MPVELEVQCRQTEFTPKYTTYHSLKCIKYTTIFFSLVRFYFSYSHFANNSTQWKRLLLSLWLPSFVFVKLCMLRVWRIRRCDILDKFLVHISLTLSFGFSFIFVFHSPYSLYLWCRLFDVSAFQSRYMRKHITAPLHTPYQTEWIASNMIYLPQTVLWSISFFFSRGFTSI